MFDNILKQHRMPVFEKYFTYQHTKMYALALARLSLKYGEAACPNAVEDSNLIGNDGQKVLNLKQVESLFLYLGIIYGIALVSVSLEYFHAYTRKEDFLLTALFRKYLQLNLDNWHFRDRRKIVTITKSVQL